MKMFQNGTIRKVIMKKVIFEDFLFFSPAVGHPDWTLRKFSEDSFKKYYGPFIETRKTKKSGKTGKSRRTRRVV